MAGAEVRRFPEIAALLAGANAALAFVAAGRGDVLMVVTSGTCAVWLALAAVADLRLRGRQS